jgi:DNA polymerase-1
MKDLFSRAPDKPQENKPDERPSLCLIDGTAFIFRAFHALPKLSNSKGLTTNAVAGFLAMILKLRRAKGCSRFVVVLDAGAETFRKRLYPPYKANRPPLPEELRQQLPLIQPLTEALGLPVLAIPDVEADDVIATLAGRADKAGLEVTIISSDKDLMQLVGPRVTMYDPIGERRFDPAAVEERFGVPPAQVVEVQALSGDSVDNVPGVKGIGPKGAADLIRQFGTVEKLYASLHKVDKPRTRKLLEDSAADAHISRQLVELKKDVALPPLFELVERPPDQQRLLELLTDLEFKKQIKELGLEQAQAAAQVSVQSPMPPVTLVDSPQALAQLARDLEAAPRFALDTETTSLNPMQAGLVGLSFSTAQDRIWYLPVGHRGPLAGTQLPLDQVRDVLGPLLGRADGRKVGQNHKFDRLVLRANQVPIAGLGFDTLLASALLDPQRDSHSLDALALSHLGWNTIKFQEVTSRSGMDLGFEDVPVLEAARYSGEDAWVTLRLFDHLSPELEASPLAPLFHDVEIPVCEILADMEFRGITVDCAFLDELAVRFRQSLADLEKRIHYHAGFAFNINSTKQLADLLFARLNLPVVKKTKTGASTDSVVLEELKHLHPVPALVLEYRGLSKLLSTYVEALPALVNPRTGRIHTSFHQAVTATGRLSSSDPNLQNIPVHTPEGRLIRKAFVPGPGKLFLAADYSQVELRVMAHLSGDPGLLEAFRNGEDIHTRTACELFGYKPEQVGNAERSLAKTINFGVLYGMTSFRLARDMGISRKRAQEFIDTYFERFAGVRRYMDETLKIAREQGQVTTLLGRRRPIPELHARDGSVRAHGERMAVNTPVQGSAADIVKLAMIACARDLAPLAGQADLLLQVHDELIFEVDAPLAPQLSGQMVKLMEGAYTLATPLKVDAGTGPNWADIEKIRRPSTAAPTPPPAPRLPPPRACSSRWGRFLPTPTVGSVPSNSHGGVGSPPPSVPVPAPLSPTEKPAFPPRPPALECLPRRLRDGRLLGRPNGFSGYAQQRRRHCLHPAWRLRHLPDCLH